MKRTAIVAGATGLVGNELVRLLLQNSGYDRVIAIVRRPLDSASPRLTQLVTDWQRDKLESELKDLLRGAHLFCALGTTIKQAKTREQFRKVDLEYPLMLGEWAKKYGASCYLLVTAMGASSGSSIFYNRVKGEVEEALRKLQLPSLHIFRPSFLLGERNERRIGEIAAGYVLRALPFLFIGPLRRYKPIQAAAVARGMIRAAKQASRGVTVYNSDRIAELSRK
ncbi:NAD-dependent epimerase/dehydratase family protein [Paenibacillus thalictri]|uniref:NAD-dependent epimerase/dehydratase family protein n=1 Tax=Paenibacillus thalictri TaxID=2527873 RepID=A0A4Q9DWF3_9BACL|nr:NAD-dependent epimerase/dehydratase family protein [Paenibacillus thalictri]TBL80675.1 NAD-dependent epimerase/dehydratase family protein [Paenibacillus thalictri]